MISFADLIKKVLTLYGNNFRLIFFLLLPIIIWNLALALIPVGFATTIRYMLPVAIASLLIAAFTELALVSGFSALLSGAGSQSWHHLRTALLRFPWFVVLFAIWLIIVVIGLLFLIVPGIIFAIWFIFISAVLVLEGKTFRAFKRSKQLVNGYFFPLFIRAGGVGIIIFLIVRTASEGIHYIIREVSPASAIQYLTTAGNIFGTILALLFMPIFTGTIVILYYEMRRIEGT